MHRVLPDRANLDHLKAQAKDLLDAFQRRDEPALQRVREALPAARGASEQQLTGMRLALHDAQSVVAREYGFASWAELRSRVRSGETLRALVEPHLSVPLPGEVQHALLAAMSEERATEAVAPLPPVAPLLALRNAVLTVGAVAPLKVGRVESLAAVEATRVQGNTLAVFTQIAELNPAPTADELYPVGCLVTLSSIVAAQPDGLWIVTRAVHWIRLEAIEQVGAYALARIAPFTVHDEEPEETKRLGQALRERVRALATQFPDPKMILRLTEKMTSLELADSVVANLPCSVDTKARYASDPSLKARLSHVLTLLDQAA